MVHFPKIIKASAITSFRILDLPLELRSQIYEDYLRDLHGSLPLRVHFSSDELGVKRTRGLAIPPLFHVCRQFYAESRRTFSNSMILNLEVKWSGLPGKPHDQNTWSASFKRFIHLLNTIQHVELSMGIVTYPDPKRYAPLLGVIPVFRDDLATYFSELKRAIKLATLSNGKSSADSQIRRRLSINLGYIVRFGRWVNSCPNRPTLRVPSADEYKSVLGMVNDCLLAARAAGERADLGVEVVYAMPLDNVVAAQLIEECESYDVKVCVHKPDVK